jgi:LysR family nitrogen assimilation transcriptional regulator
VNVAKLGRFSLASRRMRIAQPALSRQIRLLEEELNAQLFQRSSRGVTLTQAGKTFLEHAQSILRQVEKARSSVGERTGIITGNGTFGMPQSAGVILAVRLIERFRTDYPMVTLQMIEGIGSMIHEWMLNGQLDVGVIYDPEVTGHLETKPLWSEDLHLVGPAGAFGGKETISFSEAAVLELALPAMGNGLRGLVERYASRAGINLNTVIEADAQRIQQELAMRGTAYTILPRASVEDSIRNSKLSAVRIVSPNIPRVLALAYSSERPITPAARLLGEMISTLATELVADPNCPDLQTPERKGH